MQAVIFDLDDTIFAAGDMLHEGVAELLTILRRLGVKIGALSSSDHRVLVRLDEAGIRHHFDSVVCSDHAEEPKGTAAVHQLLQNMLVEAHETAMVSHAHSDMVLGKHAGVGKTIRVAHGSANDRDRQGADHIIEDIPAVLDVLG
ncbi:MAG TPA: HAD family hydrolase [Candidatus Saccharimonadales bacterium]|jgi:phosphoglycolate phosphatase-like HAD superfamily hydrolase|nr:HAD family hydrolase [Candidatus Saccharimonadales bacterium]